ncbi:MAG TPA: FUSC family protein [Pantanalinema sp.]
MRTPIFPHPVSRRARRFLRRIDLDRPGAIYGLRIAVTAWVAFSLASLFHVQNAYWAAMAAWIVMQPTRGILVERGLYRIAGTLIGAAVGFEMLHLLHQGYALVFALGAWMAGCAAMTYVFRRVQSYGALIAGITALVVVAPAIQGGAETLEIAVSRTICTFIGVAVAIVGGMLFVPVSPRPAFLARMRGVASGAVAFAAHALGPHGAASTREMARTLIQEMAELEQAQLVNTAGTRHGQQRVHHFNAFIGTSLEVMAAALAARSFPLPPSADRAPLLAALKAMAAHPRRPQPEAPSLAISDAAITLARGFDDRLATSLAELLSTEADVLSGEADTPVERFRHAPMKPDKDWQSASVAAVACALSVWTVGSLAVCSGWAYASLATLGVGNFVMILSTMDRPQLVAPKIFQGVVAGVLVATLFRLFLLPHATSTLDVIAMVIPFMLLGGLAKASRAIAAQATESNMLFMLAGQPFVGADTSSGPVLEGALALVMAIAAVSLGFMILPRDPGRRVRALVDLIVRDLERLADLATEPGDRWRPLMAHRLVRLTVHLGRLDNLRSIAAEDVLSALNLAHAVLDLREALSRPDLDEAERASIESVVHALRSLSSEPTALADVMNASLLRLSPAASDPAQKRATRSAVLGAMTRASSALEQGAVLLLRPAVA